MFILLGRPWVARDARGNRIKATEIETGNAVALLVAGDRPDATWLQTCASALRLRSTMPLSGTWMRSDGNILPATLDIAPERYPFLEGCRPTRTLLRTQPGGLMFDLFDPNLGSLGEVGYIWAHIGRHGRAVLLQEPMIEIDPTWPTRPDSIQVSNLLSRYGERFQDRLSLFLGVIFDDQSALSGAHRPAPHKSDRHQHNLVRQLYSQLDVATLPVDPDPTHAMEELLKYLNADRFIRRRGSKSRSIFRSPPGAVAITALGQKQRASGGTEVWLLDARPESEGVSVAWYMMKNRRGRWARKLIEDGERREVAMSHGGQLAFEMHGNDPQLKFLCHPWSGFVRIEFEGRRIELDLYAHETCNLMVYPNRDRFIIT
jgi:hypothetical protein